VNNVFRDPYSVEQRKCLIQERDPEGRVSAMDVRGMAHSVLCEVSGAGIAPDHTVLSFASGSGDNRNGPIYPMPNSVKLLYQLDRNGAGVIAQAVTLAGELARCEVPDLLP
jgi:hypothetical protein